MKIEICGRGYLGQLAKKYYDSTLTTTASFSTRPFQYPTENLLICENNADVIVNLSGPSSIEESLARPSYYREEPLIQVSRQIQSLLNHESPSHYVFISSASVYGDCNLEPADEKTELFPLSPYAEGKIEVERFLNKVSEIYVGGITVIRATSIFSNELNSRIFGKIRNGIRSNEDFELFGTGQEIRDFIHANDFFYLVTQAILDSIERGGINIYNIGSGNPISIQELVNLALESRKDIRNNFLITFNGIVRPGDPNSIAISNQKIMKLVPFYRDKTIEKLQDYFQVT